MKHSIKCERIYEKLVLLEYLKNGEIAFQETAWDLKNVDFEIYPYTYFDVRYNHIG